ncbi:LodA/GoxA family CTQ-dependent oxidase [Ramlibacter sp. WS9]|uniref:LodA/GoxA family CTQ-dependent oxidase n=1 Tax=Ramlibacter sp. WS9 TaxID=1882741 RepID=UPI001305292A|nr:LodA/GoxA family CTQ-dependent oxidase [Ramlibacter sp. WS9]
MSITSTPPADSTIVRAAIHPGIGVARVGNSPEGYYIGPEVMDPPPMAPGELRDPQGALKREAARFRIYGYNAAGEVVREITAREAEIEWTVELANKKAAWYQFQIALDIPEALNPKMADPSLLRNANVKDRASLAITPGARTIRGAGQRGAAYQFDSGKFVGTPVYLGELRTDEAGRLLVLGGHGKSASADGKPATTFANNDGWHDDTADGPVRASVTLDGAAIPVDSAWVLVAPPNYGPQLRSVRTMAALMEDVFIQAGMMQVPPAVSFSRDILPILQNQTGLQWANKGFAAQFGWGGPFDAQDAALVAKLADPSDTWRELRQQVANAFRQFERDGKSPLPWPWNYGDAMAVPPANTPRQNAAVTDTQLLMLSQWAEGRFIADWDPAARGPSHIDQVPLQAQPATLDRAAMDHCLADAFHPGCEITWPMRHASMYRAPFRLREAAPDAPALPNYGTQLTPQVALAVGGPLYAQSAGDLTRWMAVPWQTDTASCRSGYYAGYGPRYDPYVPSFWPARVPNQVLTEEDYSIVMDTEKPRSERRAAFSRRASWFRTLGPGGYTSQINYMIDHFDQMGVLELRSGIPGDADFPPQMQVENRIAPVQAAVETLLRREAAPVDPVDMPEPFDARNEEMLLLHARLRRAE